MHCRPRPRHGRSTFALLSNRRSRLPRSDARSPSGAVHDPSSNAAAPPERSPDRGDAQLHRSTTAARSSPYTGGAGSPTCAPAARSIRTHVVMHNGRPHADDFALDGDGFRFVRHDTDGQGFLRRGGDQARLLSGDGSADQSRERRQARRGVRSHVAHRRRCAARADARSAKSCAACTTITPNGPARSACATCCRTRPTNCSRAASPSSRCGGRSAIRSRPIRWRSPTRAASSPNDFVISERRYPEPGRPDLRDRLQSGRTSGSGSRGSARDEAIVFKVYDSLKDGRARWTAHTAFDDPTTPPNARPRESIEIRTLAFF